MILKILLIIFLNCIAFLSIAQHSLKIYFDKDWKKTYNSKDAEFYRVINYDSENKQTGDVKDYYKNGQVQFEAVKVYVDTVISKPDSTIGAAKWYSEKGMLTRQCFYENGKIQGEQKRWFDTGELKSITQYDNGELHGQYISYYQNGNYHYKINYDHGVIIGKKGTAYNKGSSKWDYFLDDFHRSDNPYNWKLPNGEGVKSFIMKDTGLFIQNNSTKAVIAHMDIPLTGRGGFTAGAYVKKDSGPPETGYGLVYDYKDENNFSYFLVRSDGNFCTGRKVNGEESSKVNWEKTKKLLGNNRTDNISISRNGTEIYFYINDDKVATGSYIPFTGSTFGVICEKGDISIVLKNIYTFQL